MTITKTELAEALMNFEPAACAMIRDITSSDYNAIAIINGISAGMNAVAASLTKNATVAPPQADPEPDGDCLFVYFKPRFSTTFKWAYSGRGWFPETGHVTQGSIKIANDGAMPGISSDGEGLIVVVIPDESRNGPFSFPRMIQL